MILLSGKYKRRDIDKLLNLKVNWARFLGPQSNICLRNKQLEDAVFKWYLGLNLTKNVQDFCTCKLANITEQNEWLWNGRIYHFMNLNLKI